ncbi:spore germination protein (amino acid permease) [Tumebacillus sp. BK434]|uniref:GerAB/ArcD/ProY family transporter n=1 Tax=Tumebacillus sp. BK434 TaxID=2512169 RepID=UPI001045F845|nr:GerAB/ArcD/ProY family transporter [Tumebacillus sp. BK434]TCP54676.1 spore germination protein (amino acid permease) [Tumebacillus sp. BK434]
MAAGGSAEPHKRINSIQLLFLLHTVPIGVGVLGLVRFVADRSNHDAALAILLSGLYPQIGILFIWLLLKRFGSYGLYDVFRRLFGRWLGGLLSLLFAAYCLFATVMTLRTFVELVNAWLFPMMPVWVLTVLFLLPIIYASYAGLQLLGRYAIATFFLTVWIFFMNYFPIAEGTVSHLLPIGSTGLTSIVQGSMLSALSLLGTELLLVYYPYITYKKDVLPAASIASWGVTLMYTGTAVTTLMFFSHDQLKKTIWPLLTMFKHVQIPFIERFETIIIAIWLVQIVNTCSTYLWAGMEGVQKVFRFQAIYLYAAFFLGALILSSRIAGRIEINFYLNILSKTGMAVMVVLPALLWLFAVLFRKKGGTAP